MARGCGSRISHIRQGRVIIPALARSKFVVIEPRLLELSSMSLLAPQAPIIVQARIWSEGISIDIQDLEASLHLSLSKL